MQNQVSVYISIKGKNMKKSTLQKFATWYTKKAQTKHLTNQALERLK